LSSYAYDIVGDLADLAQLTALTYLNLHGASVSGDLIMLSNLTKLEYLYLSHASQSHWSNGNVAVSVVGDALDVFGPLAMDGALGYIRLPYYTTITNRCELCDRVASLDCCCRDAGC
jgi:hypothetical protein